MGEGNGENGDGSKPVPPHKRTREYHHARISGSLATAGRALVDCGQRILLLSELYPSYGEVDQQTFVADIDYILEQALRGWARVKAGIRAASG